MNSDYPNQDLTHIAVFNIGGFHGLYKDVPLVKKKVFKRAAIVTKKIDLSLVRLKSNFQHVIPMDNLYVHTCINREFNCGVCEKCLRTLLALDAANKLDNFRAVFDIDAYKKNRGNAYLFLYEQFVLRRNPFYAKAYAILSRRHKDFFAAIDTQVKARLRPQQV